MDARYISLLRRLLCPLQKYLYVCAFEKRKEETNFIIINFFTFFMLVHNIFVSSLSLRRLTSCGKWCGILRHITWRKAYNFFSYFRERGGRVFYFFFSLFFKRRVFLFFKSNLELRAISFLFLWRRGAKMFSFFLSVLFTSTLFLFCLQTLDKCFHCSIGPWSNSANTNPENGCR